MCFAGFYLKEMTCSVNTFNSYCPWSWGILKFGEVQPMCNKCMCVKKMVHPSSLCSSALAVYRASCTPSSPATLNCPCPWTRVTSCHPPRHATPMPMAADRWRIDIQTHTAIGIHLLGRWLPEHCGHIRWMQKGWWCALVGTSHNCSPGARWAHSSMIFQKMTTSRKASTSNPRRWESMIVKIYTYLSLEWVHQASI